MEVSAGWLYEVVLCVGVDGGGEHASSVIQVSCHSGYLLTCSVDHDKSEDESPDQFIGTFIFNFIHKIFLSFGGKRGSYSSPVPYVITARKGLT